MTWLAGLMALAAVGAASNAPANPSGLGMQVEEPARIALIARLGPSVVHVRIQTTANPSTKRSELDQFFARFGGASGDRREQGSGFIVDSGRGLVLTAAHLVAKPGVIEVVGQDGVHRPARLLVADAQRGYALLQVDGLAGPAIPLSDRLPRAGESGLVVGFMLPGQSLLAIDGMVMGVVTMPTDAISAAVAPGPYYGISATIPNGGFGGAPVVNRDGQAIGLVTAIYGRDYGTAAITMMLPLATIAPSIAGHIAKIPRRP